MNQRKPEILIQFEMEKSWVRLRFKISFFIFTVNIIMIIIFFLPIQTPLNKTFRSGHYS